MLSNLSFTLGNLPFSVINLSFIAGNVSFTVGNLSFTVSNLSFIVDYVSFTFNYRSLTLGNVSFIVGNLLFTLGELLRPNSNATGKGEAGGFSLCGFVCCLAYYSAAISVAVSSSGRLAPWLRTSLLKTNNSRLSGSCLNRTLPMAQISIACA